MAVAATDSGLVSLRCADDEPRTIVFVLGESITRWDLPLTGYPRNTTPELDSMGKELIWFPDTLSSDPTTTPSVQQMPTPATLAQPDLWRTVFLARPAIRDQESPQPTTSACSVVATTVGKDPQPGSQLQCGRKSSRL
jgi:hypothetical protein